MAAIYPFRALRPRPELAARIAAVPYDVVSTDEARALADGNPISFLRVSRPELELPAGTDPYADAVYERARQNFVELQRTSLVLEAVPSLYFYRLTMGGLAQTGVAACFSIDEYERDVIKKHERTRRDKEDDRTRHIITLGAQTGPVFLVYPKSADVGAVTARVTAEAPLYDFEAVDGVRHTVWAVPADDCQAIVAAFDRIPVLYIADGHHRAASAARARAHVRSGGAVDRPGDDGRLDADSVMAVAFPHDEVRVLPYNRVVKDLNGLSPSAFVDAVARQFTVDAGPASPARRGEFSMFLENRWHRLQPRVPPNAADAVASLDVSVLQDRLLEPILGIADVRTDKRIDFVGGARGTAELERLVRSGVAAVAFSLFPVSVSDLMNVSDAGQIMPPKSTWFEPKLRDGLLSHLI